jgi:hypothetical protein
VLPVQRVEVRRCMLAPEHLDHDAEKTGSGRQLHSLNGKGVKWVRCALPILTLPVMRTDS